VVGDVGWEGKEREFVKTILVAKENMATLVW